MKVQSKKKILFICSTLNTGGAQRILSNILTNLPEDYDADLLLNDANTIMYPYQGTILDLGFPEQADKTKLIYQIRVFFRRIVKLRKLKRDRGYIAAVSFMDSANIANILTGSKYCKTIISIHTDLLEYRKQWKYRFIVIPMARLLYPKAQCVIAISEGIHQQMIREFRIPKDRVITIINGHNIQTIREMSNEEIPGEHKSMLENKTVVCTMGRMDIYKGQWHLIRAMKAVKERMPNVVLLILGEGELREYQVQLARELGIEVLFAGFIKNPFAYMKASDVFVLPSMFEGLPNALIEALAIDLPCIATDFGSGVWEILDANQEYISDRPKLEENYYAEYGMITPLCDGVCYSSGESLTKEELFLADAIKKIVEDANLRNQYRERAKEVVKRFESSVMVEKWIRAIEES